MTAIAEEEGDLEAPIASGAARAIGAAGMSATMPVITGILLVSVA
jgi:hypothetical protein